MSGADTPEDRPEAPLLAGAAEVDITPPDPAGTFIAGFGLGRRATGVAEPLVASALALEQGGVRFVLVSLDLIGVLGPFVADVRHRALEAGAIRHRSEVVLACTHTHSGPDTVGLWGPAVFKVLPRGTGRDLRYMGWLAGRVAEAVSLAVAALAPCGLRVASVDVPERWTRNDRAGSRTGGGRFDRATALALDRTSDGSRLATWLGFASHPETLWDRNTRLSPDFVGAFRRHAATRTPGVKGYWSGALGAMLTPNVPNGAPQTERAAYAEALGEALATLTEQALAQAPLDRRPSPLTHRSVGLPLHNRNWRFRLVERLGFVDGPFEGQTVATELHWLRVGDLELITVPGELCPEVGHRVDAAMSAPHRQIVGLANDEIGYVLEPAMFDDKAFKYETTMSLGRPTADALVAAVADLAGAAEGAPHQTPEAA